LDSKTVQQCKRVPVTKVRQNCQKKESHENCNEFNELVCDEQEEEEEEPAQIIEQPSTSKIH